MFIQGCSMGTQMDKNTHNGQAPKRYWLESVQSHVAKAEEIFSVFLLVIILSAVSMQVITRYLFSGSIFWGDELARYSYVWMAYFAAAYSSARGQHIVINVIDNLVPRNYLRWVECLAQLIVAAVCFALTYYSFEWLLKSARPKSSAMRVPMIWLYGGVWVAFVLMGLHSVINSILLAQNRQVVSSPEDGFYD